MKLTDYIQSQYTISDIFRLQNYYTYLSYLQDPNIVKISYTEDLLEQINLTTLFSRYKNKILILSNPDIDFPPPKKPYTYDKYFKNYSLPENHQMIDYYDKVESTIINVIEKQNLYVISHAVSIYHPRITFVPIGIFHSFRHFHLKNNKKNILCYANFGIPIDRWFGNPRKQIYEIIKQKSFITIDNIETKTPREFLNQDHYYHAISQSKFAICPRGCGLDSYRLWDCICLGCIPITEEYDGHKNFKDLPILFLKNIDDYTNLTESYLNNVYDHFLQTDFNYDKLTLSYIIQQINTYKEKLT
jgi:hypothetical protein